jgi:putative peptidoglycan lipid II flippase
MLSGILTVGGWTLASRVLGFLRDILIAALLGAGPVADAFFVANKLPNLFRRLFGEGAFNAAFVPSFTGLLQTEGRESAARFAEETIGVMAFWLVGLTIAAELLMPQIMFVYVAGYSDRPETLRIVTELSRITFPYMPLICMTALMSGVLNGLDRFAAAAAAPVIYNIVSIGCMIGLIGLVPTTAHALAWGVSISGVFQLALVAWAVHAAGMRLHLVRPRLSPRVKLLLRRMAPGLIGAGVTQLNLAMDVLIVSFLPAGTQSVLYYADRINQLPLGIIGTAVGTALLPTLSRQVAAGLPAEAVSTLNRALEYALVLTIPAAVALILVAEPITWVLFGRGAFTPMAAHLSAQSLAAYAVGLPAFVLTKVMVPAFFARGDTGTTVRWGLASILLNLALNVAFMIPLQHMGPALATSLAAWFNVGSLGIILWRRGHFAPDAELRRRVPAMALAAVVMGVVLWFLHGAIFDPMARPALRWLTLATLIGAGMATYFSTGQLLGAFDLRSLANRLRRRRA